MVSALSNLDIEKNLPKKLNIQLLDLVTNKTLKLFEHCIFKQTFYELILTNRILMKNT